jgi:hypothetical protein
LVDAAARDDADHVVGKLRDEFDHPSHRVAVRLPVGVGRRT